MDSGERALLLAALLVAWPVRLTVTGGTARWVRDRVRPPRDLDVVVDAEPGNIRALADALAEIAGWAPPARTLLHGAPCRVTTGFGPLDVFTSVRLPVAGQVRYAGVTIDLADARTYRPGGDGGRAPDHRRRGGRAEALARVVEDPRPA